MRDATTLLTNESNWSTKVSKVRKFWLYVLKANDCVMSLIHLHHARV